MTSNAKLWGEMSRTGRIIEKPFPAPVCSASEKDRSLRLLSIAMHARMRKHTHSCLHEPSSVWHLGLSRTGLALLQATNRPWHRGSYVSVLKTASKSVPSCVVHELRKLEKGVDKGSVYQQEVHVKGTWRHALQPPFDSETCALCPGLGLKRSDFCQHHSRPIDW